MFCYTNVMSITLSDLKRKEKQNKTKKPHKLRHVKKKLYLKRLLQGVRGKRTIPIEQWGLLQ